MIDYLTVIYKNYELLELQRQQFDKIGIKDYRLIIVDNTPTQYYQQIQQRDNELIVRRENNGNEFDGVSHGSALDLGVSYCTSDIICVFDSDYFLFCDLTDYIKNKFEQGYLAVGTEFWNNAYLPHFDKFNNLFKNIPCCFCGFYSRELVKDKTWIVQPYEVNWDTSYIEVGWKIREFINLNNIKTFGWICKSENNVNNFVYYDENDKSIGLHLVAGSHRSENLTSNIKSYISKYENTTYSHF